MFATRALLAASNAAPLFTHEPWIVPVHAVMTPTSETNWNTLGVTTTALYNGEQFSSGAQNDAISWDIMLPAGTWAFELIHSQNTNRGIYSVRLDDVEKGTIDGYAGSETLNVRSQVTDIVVATTGKVTLSLAMASKNASASLYRGFIHHCMFKRTA